MLPSSASAAAPLAATDFWRSRTDTPARNGGLVGAHGWFLCAIGSLILAGLLSLTLVLGRLPFLAPLFTDPLFFKRALVVHVNLALVVWFQAGTAAFLAWSLGDRIPVIVRRLALALAVAGLLGLLAGGAVPGAQPILANYVPVIDHPVFLLGLTCWFLGVGLLYAGALAAPSPGAAILPDNTLVALRAAAAANLIALATFAISARTTLTGLPPIAFYELVSWGGGHVLQVGNIATMLGFWLLLLQRWSGREVLSPSAARWLLALLVLPQAVLPLLALSGTSTPAYSETATLLMRWTIFPVVLIILGLSVRHLRRELLTRSDASWDRRLIAFTGSALLVVLGFVLGALIRGSSTLVPGHYHAAIGAVTLSLMAAAYEFCAAMVPEGLPTGIFQLARRQLLTFAIGQAVFALGFAWAGVYGLGRKQYAAEQHVRTLGEYLGLGVMGLGGLVAVAGGILFLVIMVRCVALWRLRRA